MLNRSQLHPYQLAIIEKAKTIPHIGLLLDMGLGKSVSALTIIVDSPKGKTLLVAPLSVAKNVWAAEISKWDHLKHLRVSKVLGSEKERLLALKQDADVYIINNENIAWLFGLKDIPAFDYLLLDESSRYKDPTTKRFKALKKKLSTFKRRIIATGTPCPNTVSELFAQVGILDLGERLGTTLTKFRETYLEPDQRNRHTKVIYSWKLKDGAEQEIRGRIKDICFSMNAKDYLEMPKLTIIDHNLAMDSKLKKAYISFKKDMVIDVNDKTITAVTAAVLINKLLQFTSGVLYKEDGTWETIHSIKLDYIQDLLDDGTPSLIFYHYKSSLKALQARFPDAEGQSEESIKKWREGTLKQMLVHHMSGSVGLNLQNNYARTANICFYDLPWSSESYQQAIARTYRQGQEKPVVVHRFLIEDSVDNHVVQTLAGKINVQDAVLSALNFKINN